MWRKPGDMLLIELLLSRRRRRVSFSGGGLHIPYYQIELLACESYFEILYCIVFVARTEPDELWQGPAIQGTGPSYASHRP